MLTRSTLLALLALLLAVPSAGATDFNVTSSTEFSAALVSAASNGTADRILLAAGTYTGPFTYNAPDDLEVLGAGASTTTIALSGAGEALYLEHPSAHYHVADVGFDVSGSAYDGLRINGPGTVERIRVVGSGVFNGNLVRTDAAGITVQHADLVGELNANGFQDNAPGVVTLVDSTVSNASTGIEADLAGTALHVSRVGLSGPLNEGVDAVFGASITISDSVIDLGSTFGQALIAGDRNNSASSSSSSVDARRVTIVGNGVANQHAVSLNPNGPNDDFSVALHDTLISAIAHPLGCFPSGAGGNGTITTDYSRVPAGSGGTCLPGITQTHAITLADPEFVDGAAHDFRLRFDSPLIDAGDPAALPATQDFAGDPRPVDGDGNGTAVGDVGAYEYQRHPPTATASADLASAAPGQTVTFTGSGTDVDPGESVSLSWTFDDGATATGPSASHAFATPGAHLATLTATDSAGARSNAPVTVAVAAPDGGGGPGPLGGDGPGPGSAGADLTAPILTAVRLRRAVATFTLSETARVLVRIERRVGGRYRRVKGSFALKGAIGANARRIRARLFRRLRAGRYRATFVAVDAAGNRSHARRAGFVVRRARR